MLATFYNKETKATEQIKVSRVINCTGPICNIARSDNELIRNLVTQGLIAPDPLYLGIWVLMQLTRVLLFTAMEKSETLFTLGSHMKGILWESTAVPNLRAQAERLSHLILEKIMYTNKEVMIGTPDFRRSKTKMQKPLKVEELIEYYI